MFKVFGNTRFVKVVIRHNFSYYILPFLIWEVEGPTTHCSFLFDTMTRSVLALVVIEKLEGVMRYGKEIIDSYEE